MPIWPASHVAIIAGEAGRRQYAYLGRKQVSLMVAPRDRSPHVRVPGDPGSVRAVGAHTVEVLPPGRVVHAADVRPFADEVRRPHDVLGVIAALPHGRSANEYGRDIVPGDRQILLPVLADERQFPAGELALPLLEHLQRAPSGPDHV